MMARCIICGSRRLTGVDIVHAAVLASGWLGQFDEVVEGGAAGIDRSARAWARLDPTVKRRTTFSADWRQYPATAGRIRNEQMAVYASELPGGLCIAIPAPDSKGTLDMIERALAHGLRVFVYRWTGNGLVFESQHMEPAPRAEQGVLL